MFFLNDTVTTKIYTLSLHDALPILDFTEYCGGMGNLLMMGHAGFLTNEDTMSNLELFSKHVMPRRSEEHTSELQSRPHLVCRLLLEKKNLALIEMLPCSNQKIGEDL